MIEVGQIAPAFTLLNQDRNEVRLQDLAGRWVVLYFYPRDDTPGCTTEACEFTAGINAFLDLTAFVFGCSPDSPESHLQFLDKYMLKIELLSDPDKQVIQAYGAYGEKVLYGKKTLGVIRSTVIITPDGRIARHWPNVKAAGHAEVVRQALVQLQGGSEPAAAPAVVAQKPAKKPVQKPAKAAAKKATRKAASKPAKAAAKKGASKPAKKAAKKGASKPTKKAAKKPAAKGKRR